MRVTDLGLQMARDANGELFHAYITEVNAPCHYCGEVLTGRSVVDRAMLEVVSSPESAKRFRAAEDDAFVRVFRRELEKHERRHYVSRLWAYVWGQS